MRICMEGKLHWNDGLTIKISSDYVDEIIQKELKIQLDYLNYDINKLNEKEELVGNVLNDLQMYKMAMLTVLEYYGGTYESTS